MSVDDVLELRELTALADELGDHVQGQGIRTLVMRPSRLNAWRDALTYFVESRDEAEWIREDDRKALPARARAAVAARRPVRRRDARRAQPVPRRARC